VNEPVRRRRDGRSVRTWVLSALSSAPSPELPVAAGQRWGGPAVVAVTSLTGATLLRSALSSRPGSQRFYVLTFAAAGAWIVGGVAAGPTGRTSPRASSRWPAGSSVAPVGVGALAFIAFYGAALVARRLPMLDEAIADVVQYAHEGSGLLVALTTLVNGVGEELFFRGAVYSAVGTSHPVALSTAVYVGATMTTGNPALAFASTAMGTILALQRRATGGIQAPLLAHLTWSALMLRYLPPLFRRPAGPS
jgi:membrane protease YdiL (CAAX protease family)